MGDVAMRSRREAMTWRQMREFFCEFWPGLVAEIVGYAAFTSIRQFRDLFTRDIFTAANNGVTPPSTVFFWVDFPGAVVASLCLAFIPRVKDNARAIYVLLILQILFLLVALGATLAFDGGV